MDAMQLQDHPERILHLIGSMRWTGVAEPAASLAALQLQKGKLVWAAAIWERSLEQGLAARGIPLAREIQIPRRLNPLSSYKDIRALRDFIISNQVQVVHCHLLHDHWLAALAIKHIRHAQKPLLVRTVHRYESTRRDPWHRWLFGVTNLVITVSQEQRALLLATYPSIELKLRVIHGGVNPERFRPKLPGAAAVRADLGENPENAVAGIVAHLGYNRGHHWLLDAAPEVVEKVPNATIWVVGHGELKHELRAEMREPRYKRQVIMAGYRREDLADTYCAMDVALLLGLGSEGSARAALEAMACGRPVIAIRKGALVDTITDGVDGFLVQENDVQGLAAALVALLSDRARANMMGGAARQKILAEFTELKRYQKTEAAYNEAWTRRQSITNASKAR